MKSLFIVLLLSTAHQQALADYSADDIELQPNAIDGFGRMFHAGQSLSLAIDTMIWHVIHGHRFLHGVTCNFMHQGTRSNTSTRCPNSITTASLESTFDRARRRSYHNTLRNLYDVRRSSMLFSINISNYIIDKSQGRKLPQCNIYEAHYNIVRDWPGFLNAYRADRRRAGKNELLQLFLTHLKRAYANYTEVMSTVLPGLEELCEED